MESAEGLTAANVIAILAVAVPVVAAVLLTTWRLSRLLERMRAEAKEGVDQVRAEMQQLDNKVCIYSAQRRERDKRVDIVLKELHDQINTLQKEVSYNLGRQDERRGESD